MRIENWKIEELTGYKPITTFYQDFSIADKFGVDAIQDTYNRVFKEWDHNHRYITELAMVLNWKIWRWHEVNEAYAKLYNRLWLQLDAWCIDNLKGVELEYYYKTTD